MYSFFVLFIRNPAENFIDKSVRTAQLVNDVYHTKGTGVNKVHGIQKADRTSSIRLVASAGKSNKC
jgi:hypothetical protein